VPPVADHAARLPKSKPSPKSVVLAVLVAVAVLVAMLVAVLVAVLFVAGQSLQVFYQIPFAMVRLIQAIVIICVAASEFFMRYELRWRR
jgi:simple sugar transport system permease protein